MNIKPLITYSGAGPLFRSLETQIITAIPLDTCEWKRNLHRPSKNVRLEAQTLPLNINLLEKYKRGEWSILEHPVLHIFVTECNDVDLYKSTTREEIDIWLKQLNSYGVSDWMILLVETLDVRKTKNLLPRTTVLDKIRLDFGTKNDDRCISVLNPAKFEQKSTESFRCLIQRIRFLMLTSYNRNISKYEEIIRVNREKRNQDGWDYRKYFFLQEDLALIFEKLELYTDALIQYDELDAMLSQFITNSGFGEKQKWLDRFKNQLTSFHGICLSRRDKFEMREKIHNEEVTILEFRNYLFERQSCLLQLSNKTSEIAERLLNFLFSTLREIELIKVDYQEGALSCWEFVCALETLQTCDQAMEPNEVACFQHCAPIWNLAKDKLYELGKLCGLLPGFTPTSEQLHIVVQFSAGIGDTPVEQKFLDPFPQIPDKRSHSPNRRPKKSATDQLKEALSSSQAFQKLYLELSELAISTYKHISRLRSARLAGLDLGKFYCALDEPHKAVVFFIDLLRELKAENWNCISSQTLLELAKCYDKLGDIAAYTKTCSAISCCNDLDMLVRTYYFDEFLKNAKFANQNLKVASEQISNTCILEDHFKICDIEVMNQNPVIQDDIILVHMTIESFFPREVFVDKIALSYETKTGVFDLFDDEKSTVKIEKDFKLNISLHLDYKQDNNLSSASVACEKAKIKKTVRRTSSTKRKLSSIVQSDFSNFVSAESVVIRPGKNNIEMKTKATRVGLWKFKQLSLRMLQLEFLSDQITSKATTFEVTIKSASAVLSFINLIAGIEQPMRLIISSGSFIFPADAKILLRCSKKMSVRIAVSNDNESNDNDFQSSLYIPLLNFKPFEEREISLEVLTDLPGRNVAKYFEHNISLSCPWSRNDIQIPLTFMSAMEATCRLHTCGTQKFLQIILKGLDANLYLNDAKVECDAVGVKFVNLNPSLQSPIQIYKSLTVSHLYEVQVEPLKTENELPVIKVHFSIKYATVSKPNLLRNYMCSFDVLNYTTLFKVQAQLEPNELCRVRSVCNLNLRITKVNVNSYEDLLYEVLTDQNLWAVCGRSAGVVSMKNVESHSISLDVMPLSTGFLPMPSIRLSKYIAGGKNRLDSHSKIHPFPPGQVYNSTKSMQIHVIASVAGEG